MKKILVTGPSDVRMDEQEVIRQKVRKLIEENPDAEFVFTSFPGVEFLAMNECFKAGVKVKCFFPWRQSDAHVLVRNLLSMHKDKVECVELKSLDYGSHALFMVRQQAVSYATDVVVFTTESVVDLPAFTLTVAHLTNKSFEQVRLFSEEQQYAGYFSPGDNPVNIQVGK